MTDWIMQSNVDDPQILSRRLGAFLKRQGSVKQLALRLDADPRTIENIRLGRAWPIARHWLSIWLEFGDDVLEAVFYPERVEARLLREAEERDKARRRRLSSISLGSDDFGLAHGLGEGAGEDEGPTELGPPNLELFEELPTEGFG
jgi:hypothetical protein